MNATSKFSLQRLLLLILLGTGLATALPESADAHKIEYRPVTGNHFYYQHGRRLVFPRWLRTNRDFQRWYLRSDYRYIRRANWSRLYDLYLYENRYRRRAHNHYHGKVYVDLNRSPRRRYR